MKTYTVKWGDTLTTIAKEHNVSVDDIVKENGIKNKNLIYVGQKLHIPTKEPDNRQLYNAFITCLDAIEDLPEFQVLSELLEG